MKKPVPIRRPRPSEEGYVLVAVIFLVALLTIALAVALPKISKEIQRDRELETMHRGKQYARAVKLYYKKFGAYPPSVDALFKPTNNIRFLRKKYADPTTGKEEWKPVRFGKNKAPTAMGFFGQPIGGATVAGTGPGGAGGLPGGSSLTGTNGLAGSSSFGQQTTTPTPDPNAPQGQGTDTSSTVSGTTPAGGTASGSAPGSAPGSTTGSATGPTFGGAGIIGFSPNSPKQSILVYKTKNHYNEWEFVYDPIAEQMMMQGGNAANKAGLTPTPTQNPTQNPNLTPTPSPTPQPAPPQ